MNAKDVVSRAGGLNCPIFGVTSQPTRTEVDAARHLIDVLEDRRVLFNPFALEDPHHCVQSVIELRKLLTLALENAGVTAALSHSIKAMRAACRKFLNRTQPESAEYDGRPWRGAWGQSDFFDALGELRGVFGVHIVVIVACYGLDVEDELASILPNADEDDDHARATS